MLQRETFYSNKFQIINWNFKTLFKFTIKLTYDYLCHRLKLFQSRTQCEEDNTRIKEEWISREGNLLS